MTFDFGDRSVTTWHELGGGQVWRVTHRDGTVAYFRTESRAADIVELIQRSRDALSVVRLGSIYGKTDCEPVDLRAMGDPVEAADD